MKVKAAWEGEFRNGVFLDGQKIKGNVEPQSGDRYVVDMGTVSGADLRFVQDWLGHSNIQNTVVYTFLTTRGRDGAARRAFLNLPRY